jgi:hypothetical protein
MESQCCAITTKGRQCHRKYDTPKGDREKQLCWQHATKIDVVYATGDQKSPITQCSATTTNNTPCRIACEDRGGDPEEQLCRIHLSIQKVPAQQKLSVERSILPQLMREIIVDPIDKLIKNTNHANL